MKKIGIYFLFNFSKRISLNIPNIKMIGSYFLPNCIELNYTLNILKAMDDDVYLNGRLVNKIELVRSLKISKLLC